MGVYVGKTIGRDDPARRCSVDGDCRAYAFYPQKAKWQMGPGARCQHAVPRVKLRGVTADKANHRTPLFICYSLTDPGFFTVWRSVRSRLGQFDRMSYVLPFGQARTSPSDDFLPFIIVAQDDVCSLADRLGLVRPLLPSGRNRLRAQ
jgi:hypothetical protein